MPPPVLLATLELLSLELLVSVIKVSPGTMEALFVTFLVTILAITVQDQTPTNVHPVKLSLSSTLESAHALEATTWTRTATVKTAALLVPLA